MALTATTLAGAALLAAGTVTPAAAAGASTLPTAGLTRVSIRSSQALPPPYKPGHVVLDSAASLRAFEDAVHTDRIGVATHPTNAGGCTGGIQYTVVMTYNTGRKTSLDAYRCGTSLTGNMTGNVRAFVHYLASLLG